MIKWILGLLILAAGWVGFSYLIAWLLTDGDGDDDDQWGSYPWNQG